MFTKLSKYLFYPVLIFHLFIANAFSQSPASPNLLSSPFEPIVTISAGVQKGWGYGNISDLNHWGIFGIADFTQYKFQMAIGITENEDFKNTFSFNSGIAISLRNADGDFIVQPALFSGFGYTKIYTSSTDSYDMLNIPLGVSLGLNGPTPFGDINISISPKIQYRYLKLIEGKNIIGLGVNIGILFTPSGKNIGIKIGYDFLNIEREPLVGNEIERSLIVGLEYLLY